MNKIIELSNLTKTFIAKKNVKVLKKISFKFKSGKIETIIVIIIEHIDITKIDDGFISDGILLKKYISSGNKLILNVELKN